MTDRPSRKVTLGFYKKLPLKPELVPRPLWGRSVAQAFGRRKPWKLIRQAAIDASEGACTICGSFYDKGMICHEEWDYDDRHHTATLTGFKLVCRECSSIIHYGRTGVWLIESSAQGTSDAEIANIIARKMAHFQKVSNLTPDEAEDVIRFAGELWRKRSDYKWRVKIDPSLEKEFPQLKGLRL